jgi:hypothetical protein
VLNFWSPNDRNRQLQRDVIEMWHRRGRRWTVWFSSLFWGGFMFIWMTALDFIRHPGQQFKGLQEVLWLILPLSFWLCGGYVVGIWVWRKIERKRRKLWLSE